MAALAEDDDTDVRARTEDRMTKMVVAARVGTSFFLYLPLSAWGQLRHPLLALGCALAATGETTWFARRTRRGRSLRDDRTLVWVDLAFCLVLMAVGSRAAPGGRRNELMTELVPFSLVSPAAIGFALGASALAVAAVGTLMTTWSLSVLPDVTQKLSSDLSGFLLWYVVALWVGYQLRDLARRTAAAQAHTTRVLTLLGEQEKAIEGARQRDLARAIIHDRLLPVVERLVPGAKVDEALAKEARRAAYHARRYVVDGPDGEAGVEFAGMMAEIRETFTDAGMAVDDVFRIERDPPRRIGAVFAAATLEALHNVARHAATGDPVHLYVHSAGDAVEVVVRDRGVGFDRASAPRRGGLGGTYDAVRRAGGMVTVDSSPGRGTKVVFVWPVRMPQGVGGGGEA